MMDEYIIEKGIISGTDIGAIMGYSDYSTPWDVWNKRKNGIAKEYDDFTNTLMSWGNDLEDLIAKRYAKDNNVKVRRCMPISDGWMSGSPDRMVKDNDGNRWGLEIKTSMVEPWDEPPMRYILQCRWYMMLTNLDRWDLIALFKGSRHKSWTITRHQQTEEIMRNEAYDFYKRFIDGEDEPYNKSIEQTGPESVYNPQIDDLWKKHLDLKADEKRLKVHLKALKTKIELVCGNTPVTYGDKYKVIFTQHEKKTRQDDSKHYIIEPEYYRRMKGQEIK